MPAQAEASKERKGSILSLFAIIMSDMVIVDAVYIVIGSGSYDAVGIGFFPWASLTTVALVFYRIFLLRERTVVQAVTFLTIFYIGTVFILFTFFYRPPGIILTLIAMLLLSLPLWRIYFLTVEPPEIEKLVSRVGAMTFILLLLMISVTGADNPYTVMLPSAITLIICMIVLVIVRTTGSGADSSRRFRGVVSILAFLLLIGVITAAFLLFASAAFGTAIAAGATVLWGGVVYFGNLLMRFLMWLISLLPALELAGEYRFEPMPGAGEVIYSGESLSGLWDTLILAVLVGIIAIVIAVTGIMVIKFRRKKLGGKYIKSQIGFVKLNFKINTEIVKYFINRAKFIIDSMIYRNTPQGVFLRIERLGKLKRRGRKIGETPRHYLMRLALDAPQHRELFFSLADALDESWYGGADAQKFKGKFKFGFLKI